MKRSSKVVEAMPEVAGKVRKVTITKNGPYLVSGGLPLQKEVIVYDEKEGCPVDWEKGAVYPLRENYALCRCGGSKNKPYCDGSHIDCGFNDGDASLKK